MSNRLLRAVALAVAAVSFVAVGPTRASNGPRHSLFPVTVKDDTGVSVTLPKRPRRIVSLDPRDTETLFALNLSKRLVADGGQYVEGAYCCRKSFRYPAQWPSPWGLNYPARAHTLTHIEGGYDAAHPFDVELVVSKRPDVVFSLNADPDGIKKMRDLGLKVVVLDPHGISQILHDMSLVGRVTGNVSEARQVVSNIRTRLAAVRRKLAGDRTHPRVFYEIDDSTGTPYTACAGSFIDQMLGVAKAVNVAHSVQPCPRTNPYPQMQTEAVVAANPGVILLGDSNYGVTASQVRARIGWQTISAVRRNRIYKVDDDLISRAGPREIIGLETVAKLLHR